MATLASNQIGVYFVGTDQTSPLEVYSNASAPTSNPTGVSNGDHFIWYDSDDEVFGGLYLGASSITSAETIGSSQLLAAATSTSLDATNTINEVAARNGAGSSTNYIASGAFSWNFTIDGLIDLTANGDGDTGSPITILDAAKDSYYVLVRFTTKVGSNGNGDADGVVSYVGQALIESATLTGGVDDISTYSATFRGYGDLYKYIGTVA
jgi:hypothetical protein